MDGPLPTYVGLCCIAPFVAPWDVITPDSRSLIGPADPDAALATLVERHSVEELLASRLVERTSDGSLALNPILAGPSPLLIAVYRGATGSIIDLIADRGCLSGRWPFVAILFDEWVRRTMRDESTRLVLVGDTADAMRLCTLGIPAVPVGSIAHLGREDIASLARVFAFDVVPNARQIEERFESRALVPPSSPGPDASEAAENEADIADRGRSSACAADVDRVELVFAMWSPTTMSLDTPPVIAAAIARLTELEKHRVVTLCGVYTWHPANFLEDLQFSMNDRDNVGIADAVVNSWFQEPRQLASPRWPTKVPDPPLDYATAREALRDVARNPTPDNLLVRRRRIAAEAAYRTAAESTFVTPLERRAESECKPIHGMELILLADDARQYFALTAEIMGLENAGASTRARNDERLREASSERARVVGRIHGAIRDSKK